MNMFEAVGACFSKFATFSGRARRAEYWWFTLFNVIVGLVLGFAQGGAELGIADLYSLVILLPSLAVSARRLHDTGRSGWWQLLVFVPIVGWIVLLIWFCQPSNVGHNIHGADPIGGDAAPLAA